VSHKFFKTFKNAEPDLTDSIRKPVSLALKKKIFWVESQKCCPVGSIVTIS